MAESNYEKVKERWRKRFLEMDQEDLIRRFHMDADEKNLYLDYFSRRYCINRENGQITDLEDPDMELTFNTVIGFYNIFHYAAENPKASGTLVPFREVKRVYPFEAAYKKTVLHEMEQSFSGKIPELIRACEKLHGTKLKQGDAGYVIPVFPFLNMAVLFWDGDDEFPAQANMLFDSEITSFMHEENVVGIASDAVYYLQMAAGIDRKIIYGE